MIFVSSTLDVTEAPSMLNMQASILMKITIATLKILQNLGINYSVNLS